MSVTFLSARYRLTHFIELSYTQVFSRVPPALRTVRLEPALSILSTLPSQRASLAAFVWAGAWCANTAPNSKVSINANSRVPCFFSIVFLSLLPGSPARNVICNPNTRPWEPERASFYSRNSVQHFVLTFFSDHLLELPNNIVPPRHHCLYFVLGEVMLGFFGQRARIQRLQFLQQLAVASYQVFRRFRFFVLVRCDRQIFQFSPIRTLVRLGSESEIS